MKTRHLLITLVCLTLVSLAGCAQQITRNSASKSLSKMIAPVKDSQQITKKTPLALPVSVAIVTVPSADNSNRPIPNTTLRLASDKLKQQLLSHSKYVRSVAVVEQDDMRGPISLDRVRALYGADIAILLSHQQDQRASQKGVYGLIDASIIGAFLVKGLEIKTTSVIDGKVIHIPSHAMVFRASGTDQRSSKSTSYEQNGSLTEESIDSMVAATTDFGKELARALTRFDQFDLSQAVPMSTMEAADSAAANDYWRQVDSYKSTGGGAFGIIPLLICAATCCAAWWRK